MYQENYKAVDHDISVTIKKYQKRWPLIMDHYFLIIQDI
jgi:hypothetical protein